MSSKITTAGKARAPGSQRVTLRTIAEMTGLSLSTVSLSLRGGTTLKQETRDKVAEAAKALGYVPDRAGVRLRTRAGTPGRGRVPLSGDAGPTASPAHPEFDFDGGTFSTAGVDGAVACLPAE